MIVVTGGAGFIGSNLVAALEAAGQRDLVVCDRLGQDDKWRNIAKRDLADLIAPEALFEFLEARKGTIETIFHMGAISATTATDADLIVSANIDLPQRLWHWCAANGARLIYASSAATYGDGAQGFSDSMNAADLAALRPLNAYGWSKLAFDRRVARFVGQAAKPPQWAGLRFFNVYGPNEYHKGGQMSVVPQIYNRVAAGQPARLFRSHRPDYADGGQLRDFIAVEDCVDVMLWLHANPTVSGLYNCGTGASRSFHDLASAVFRALGQEPDIEFIDTPEAIRGKYQYFTQADMAKLRRAGYDRQFTSLEAGVSRYVLDYLAAEDPYR